MVVIDASVALAWGFADERTEQTQQILAKVISDGAHVPELWFAEVCNALLSAERRGRLSSAEVTHFLELLAQLPIELPETDLPMTEVAAAARQFGLTAYDATYLLLAMKLGTPLATLDRQLRAAGSQAGVEIWPTLA